MPFLDIGSMELFLVAVIALVVEGPTDLPKLMRGVMGYWRQMRGFASEMRRGMDTLAREVEEAADPFHDLKKQEGITPSMTPEEITEKIMNNRGQRTEDPTEELGPESPATSGDSPTAAVTGGQDGQNTDR